MYIHSIEKYIFREKHFNLFGGSMPNLEFIVGDVFLFEPDPSCVSRLICKLSNSPVSHAAMYFEDGTIIEEGIPQVGTRKISALGERKIHVRRYDKSNEALCKTLYEGAKKRLDANEPYSMGNLVMVGALTILNMWKPEAKKEVKLALSALCVLLANAIDKKMTGGRGTTCSQFVYEVYKNAGAKLQIDRGSGVRPVSNGSASSSHKSPSLLSLAIESAASGRTAVITCDNCDSKSGAINGESLDLETLSCILLAILEKAEKDTDKNSVPDVSNDILDDEMYAEVIKFASLFYQLDNPQNFDRAALFSKDGLKSDWIKLILEHMLKNYSGFVMPGDLYYDCPDLKNEIVVLNG